MADCKKKNCNVIIFFFLYKTVGRETFVFGM